MFPKYNDRCQVLAIFVSNKLDANELKFATWQHATLAKSKLELFGILLKLESSIRPLY